MSQATAANATIKNTNRWSTRQLVTMALMCAIAALLSFVQIPILPAAPFLTYDPSLMPAMVCGFAFGPGAGFAVGAVAAIIHSLMLGEWVGGLMNICATLFFVVPAAAIYARKHTFAGAIIGLLVGCVVAFVVSLLAIRFLMDYVKKHTFTAFGWYRIALGIVVLAIWALQSYVMPI